MSTDDQLLINPVLSGGQNRRRSSHPGGSRQGRLLRTGWSPSLGSRARHAGRRSGCVHSSPTRDSTRLPRRLHDCSWLFRTPTTPPRIYRHRRGRLPRQTPRPAGGKKRPAKNRWTADSGSTTPPPRLLSVKNAQPHRLAGLPCRSWTRRFRDPLVAGAREGSSYEEIAEVLDCPLGKRSAAGSARGRNRAQGQTAADDE